MYSMAGYPLGQSGGDWGAKTNGLVGGDGYYTSRSRAFYWVMESIAASGGAEPAGEGD